MSIGVPIKILHEAEGHIVTCETNTGEVYRGKLIEAEDNMNCQVCNFRIISPLDLGIKPAKLWLYFIQTVAMSAG